MSPYRPMDGHAPTDPALLARPLDFIQQDHYREREICGVLDRAAALLPCSKPELEDALAFVACELPLHLSDEEEDLFPLMRRRCTREDDIDRVIARLREDHGHAVTDAVRIAGLLRLLLAVGRLALPGEGVELARFARHARRHLIVENAIILPLARARLTLSDLRSLALRMAARRDIMLDMDTVTC